MTTGKDVRLGRLLGDDGRALIVALDRPRALWTPALADPVCAIAACRAGGADAVILGLGTLRLCADSLGGLGSILAVGPPTEVSASMVVDQALRWGVDAVKFEAFPFGERGTASLNALAEMGAACDQASILLLGEMIPIAFEATNEHTRQAVATAARLGAECGADMVKVPLPIDGGISEIVEYAAVPTVVLGGPARPRREILDDVARAVDQGATGAAIGRNIFQDADMTRAVREFRASVHGRPVGGRAADQSAIQLGDTDEVPHENLPA